jgi:hypothetical protein
MTKDEMVTLLRSVNCDENTVTAMSNAYEMGFEQGAAACELLKDVVERAAEMSEFVNFEHAKDFYAAYDKLKGAA